MAYGVQTLIPRGKLSDSQPELLDNFDAINDFIGVDHADFTAPNPGFHNKLTFPQQALTGNITDPGDVNIIGVPGTGVPGNVVLILQNAINIINGAFNAGGGSPNSAFVTLPSGTIIKAVITNLQGNDPNGDYTFTWGPQNPFNHQYWVIMIPTRLQGVAQDPVLVPYVRGILNATQFRYTVYRRGDSFSLPISALNATFCVIAIGD